jgi:XRE family transcriptional regulator, regulator of sulfur utilization
MRLDPTRVCTSHPHALGTEELVICPNGTLTLGPEGSEQHLRAGDGLHFAADVPHSYRSDDGCLALCSLSYPAVRGHT